MLNKLFVFLEDKTRWLYQKDLIKNWFNVISWTTLTAIVFAMADKFESYFLWGFGFVSFVLVFSMLGTHYLRVFANMLEIIQISF
jgi:hypothetical protein